jgi:uncharacterized protein (TIGR02444 family)
MTVAPENPFWDFSLAIYARDGVAPACLSLQDRLAVDVNVLLYCCWIGSQHGTILDADMVNRLVGRVSDWKMRVVEPLRSVRRALKSNLEGVPNEGREALRSDVKRLELQAERLEQDMLVNALEIPSKQARDDLDGRSCARHNIDCYLVGLGIEMDPITGTDTNRILDAVFS